MMEGLLFCFFSHCQNSDCSCMKNLFYFNPVDSTDIRIKGNIKMGMKRSAASNHKCCYPVCQININLKRVPKLLQYDVLKKYNFFILDGTKMCPEHLNVESWRDVNDVTRISNFKGEQIGRIIEILRDPKPSWNQSVCGNRYFHFILGLNNLGFELM